MPQLEGRKVERRCLGGFPFGDSGYQRGLPPEACPMACSDVLAPPEGNRRGVREVAPRTGGCLRAVEGCSDIAGSDPRVLTISEDKVPLSLCSA